MPTGVSHTYGGQVAIADLASGKRYDVTPDSADEAAVRCDAAAEAGRADFTILIPTVSNDAFAYSGDPAAFRLMASQLRHAAAAARQYASRLK
jgi:hypothetical protein